MLAGWRQQSAVLGVAALVSATLLLANEQEFQGTVAAGWQHISAATVDDRPETEQKRSVSGPLDGITALANT